MNYFSLSFYLYLLQCLRNLLSHFLETTDFGFHHYSHLTEFWNRIVISRTLNNYKTFCFNFYNIMQSIMIKLLKFMISGSFLNSRKIFLWMICLFEKHTDKDIQRYLTKLLKIKSNLTFWSSFKKISLVNSIQILCNLKKK